MKILSKYCVFLKVRFYKMLYIFWNSGKSECFHEHYTCYDRHYYTLIWRHILKVACWYNCFGVAKLNEVIIIFMLYHYTKSVIKQAFFFCLKTFFNLHRTTACKGYFFSI